MYFDKLRLDGKRAVITGGASGIGAACTDALLEAGAQVVIADYSDANLSEARSRLGVAAVSFERIDVTDSKAVDALATRLGPVDILVNSTGIGRQTAAEDVSDSEWHEVLRINLDGVFWCARAFGRVMVTRGKSSIVNIGSMAGE
jgi:NAD(P)-dependent dehydrogenase (short-subunit alcohol dehydrogenase family)